MNTIYARPVLTAPMPSQHLKFKSICKTVQRGPGNANTAIWIYQSEHMLLIWGPVNREPKHALIVAKFSPINVMLVICFLAKKKRSMEIGMNSSTSRTDNLSQPLKEAEAGRNKNSQHPKSRAGYHKPAKPIITHNHPKTVKKKSIKLSEKQVRMLYHHPNLKT